MLCINIHKQSKCDDRIDAGEECKPKISIVYPYYGIIVFAKVVALCINPLVVASLGNTPIHGRDKVEISFNHDGVIVSYFGVTYAKILF